MPLVYIDDLRPGMILADDLFTPKGRFVLAEGTEVQPEHLQPFKTWGIIEIDVTEESLGEEYLQEQAEQAVFLERAEVYLYRRFVLNELDREPLSTIYQHAVHRAAANLQKGWEPELYPAELTRPDKEQCEVISVANLIKGDVELVSLPTIYSHIVDAISNPDTTTAQLAEVVSKDASLSVRLLKLVNSPFYGFSGKIDSISRAVSLLGTDELSNLALGVTVVRQFRNIPTDLFNMDAFWRHSIRCGLYARILATHLELDGVEKYFIGGLLHDIGRLIIIEQMPDAYKLAVIKAREEQIPLCRAEQEVLQTDHSIVGKLLALRWRLPLVLARMIGGHHAPSSGYYPMESCLMHVADMLAHACGHEINLVNEVPPLVAKAWEETGLKTEMIAPTIRQVDGEFRGILQIFFSDSES